MFGNKKNNYIVLNNGNSTPSEVIPSFLPLKKEKPNNLLEKICQLYFPLLFSIFILIFLLHLLFKLISENQNIFNNYREKRNLNNNLSIYEQNYTKDINKSEDKFKEILESYNNFKDISPKKSLNFYTPKLFGNKTLKISFNYSKAIMDQLYKKIDDNKIKSFPKDKLKFALCTIGKLENLYARDFIIYYLELGVDKIYIYDNNEIYGEKFEDVVQDFIDDNHVEIINIRGKQNKNPQNYAYEKCYHEHIKEYDWFLFFDFDEYLYIEENTLNNFVQLPKFVNCSAIVYFYRHYTDNNQLYYNSESPIKRFPIPIPEYAQRSKFINGKSMAKGKINELSFMKSIHAPFFENGTYNEKYITCNSEGNIVWKFNNEKKNYSHITYKNAFLKHYQWKSTEEYCIKLGIRRFFKSYNWGKDDYIYLKNIYLRNNPKMEEKLLIIKDCIEKE